MKVVWNRMKIQRMYKTNLKTIWFQLLCLKVFIVVTVTNCSQFLSETNNLGLVHCAMSIHVEISR